MKNESNYRMITSKTITFKFVFLFTFLITSLIIFNSCKQLGVRENREMFEWENGENDFLSEMEVNKRLELEFEILQYAFTFEKDPKDMKSKFSLDIYEEQNRFEKSMYKIKTHHHRGYTNLIFIAHKDNFDDTFQEFKKELPNINKEYPLLSSEFHLLIYLESKNQLYVEKITKEIVNSKLKLKKIYIHSNEPSSFTINGNVNLESIHLTGNHEVIDIENSLKINKINIHSTERLQSFTCNLESTTSFFSNGKVIGKNVLKDVFKNSFKLKHFEIRNSELEEMPDLSTNENMDELKFIGVSFKEIDLNKMPKSVRKFEVTLLKEPSVILPKTKKTVKQFSIIPKEKNKILQNALEKMKE